MNDYLTKKKIINFIVNNEKEPSKFNLQKDFGSLTVEQLNQYKDCNKKFNAISFNENDVFFEEKQLVL